MHKNKIYFNALYDKKNHSNSFNSALLKVFTIALKPRKILRSYIII